MFNFLDKGSDVDDDFWEEDEVLQRSMSALGIKASQMETASEGNIVRYENV